MKRLGWIKDSQGLRAQNFTLHMLQILLNFKQILASHTPRSDLVLDGLKKCSYHNSMESLQSLHVDIVSKDCVLSWLDVLQEVRIKKEEREKRLFFSNYNLY